MSDFYSTIMNLVNHDDRQSYNPPAVQRPSIDDAQFAYDNQRDIEVSILANPAVLAMQFVILRERVKSIEEELKNDDRKD